MMLAKSITRMALCLVLASLLQSGCRKPAASPAPAVAAQTGVASWYGHPFDGRATASGEIYDMEKMTAAHRTLPLGTVVRVVSQINGQQVQVRINDRGPFVQDRIIDLSHGAAQAISMPGIATVSLNVISTPPTRGVESYAVQVGSFATQAEASQLRSRMEAEYGTASLVFRPGDQSWRVLVGMEATAEGANGLAQKLDKEAGPAFVVLMDPDQ